MKINTSPIWLGSAALIAAVGLGKNSFDLLIVAFAAAGMGVATMLPGLKQRWLSQQLMALQQPRIIDQMEQRLRLTEDELATTARELAALKEKHEFDSQLHMSTKLRGDTL